MAFFGLSHFDISMFPILHFKRVCSTIDVSLHRFILHNANVVKWKVSKRSIKNLTDWIWMGGCLSVLKRKLNDGIKISWWQISQDHFMKALIMAVKCWVVFLRCLKILTLQCFKYCISRDCSTLDGFLMCLLLNM
jgi:hypothetical protein